MRQDAHAHRGPSSLTRRSVLGLFAGLGMTGLLAACGGGNQGTTASTQVPSVTTPQAPAANQTVIGTATPVASPSPAASPSPSPAAGR